MPLSDEHKDGLLSSNIAAREALRIINSTSWGEQYLAMEPLPPLTRRERLQRRLSDYRERIILAWRVLRGDDIHEDCDP